MESRPATLLSPAGKLLANQCPSDDDLLAYLPGELSGPQAESIVAHLATCPLCKSRISTLKQRLSDQHPAREAAAPVGSASLPAPAGSDSPLTIANELRPSAGHRLNEYELLEPIGRGGMGVVYRARHVRLQRIVAVKVLPRMALADESAVIRMQRETAAAGRVQHPNIVYATDAGECDGVHYLVMEFVPGVDLSKLVAVAGQLPIPEACEIVRQAALGLGHIAECGLVHRDLKPSNLMLADDGAVKILDLGLALLRHNPLDDYEATQPGYLLGTADYIAPEQIDAPHEVDVRSDLYSLGCTLYKLLAGVAPFSGPEQYSVSRKVEAHRHQPPPPVRSLRPEVPEELERLLARLLAKHPADRFQRPADLARALAPLAQGASLPALARRLSEAGELDVPLGEPGHTPADSHATTKSIARSATPRPFMAVVGGSPTWARLVAVAALVVALLGVALAVVPRLLPKGDELPPIAGGGIAPPRFSPPAPSPNKIVYEVSGPLNEYKWLHWSRSPPPKFNDMYNMLEVEPWTHQLIELGQYDGRPGTFSVTISQARWHGAMGIYFGCRPEPKLDQNELTTFQYFELQYIPGSITREGKENFRLMRQRAIIPVFEKPYLRQDVETVHTQSFAAPRSRQIRIDITFGKDGVGNVNCERVAVNDQELKLLTTPELNQKYLPEDYRDSFGLYAAQGPGPKWFSNVVFTPVEK